MNEPEWIERASAGDQQAWTHLVQQHQTAVFRLAYLLLGNAEDAQDVAQEVFVRAWRALERFEPNRPLQPWLLEITRNQCSNWRRSLGRYLAALTRWRQTQSFAATEMRLPEAAAAALWQSVRQLSQADQEVIYLRCFLELSVEECAQTLGIAPGTVKSRLSRALARLRPLLELEQFAFREEVAE